MTNFEIKEYLGSRGARIEEHLDRLVPERKVPYGVLFQAARYSLLGAGKRLRPILALATAETFGGSLDAALTPACALEMIHAYSLIHDDLPCMDDDDFRRGKPSLHKAFPEGQAVLAGDFLLTYAFDILAHASELSSAQRIQLISVLSQRAGGDGMIAGQVMDLEAEGKKIDLETLRLIHRNKTGAMISAAIEFGGIVANVAKRDFDLLQQFGNDIGLAFQIVDDILDVTASQQKHGKTIASDVANCKATYVSLLGLEHAQHMAQAQLESALSALQKISRNTSLLSQLAQLIVFRKS